MSIVPFTPIEVGSNFRFDPDDILDAAKGNEFISLVIIGQLPDGTYYIAGNCNAGESLILMERAKMNIIGA